MCPSHHHRPLYLVAFCEQEHGFLLRIILRGGPRFRRHHPNHPALERRIDSTRPALLRRPPQPKGRRHRSLLPLRVHAYESDQTAPFSSLNHPMSGRHRTFRDGEAGGSGALMLIRRQPRPPAMALRWWADLPELPEVVV